MYWIALAAVACAILGTGLYVFRRSKIRIVRWYMAITAILFVIYFMNFAAVLGAEYLAWPKFLLLAFLPGTAVLMVLAIKRDRDEVLGPSSQREAATTAAIVYGAGSYAEPGADIGGGMDSQ